MRQFRNTKPRYLRLLSFSDFLDKYLYYHSLKVYIHVCSSWDTLKLSGTMELPLDKYLYWHIVLFYIHVCSSWDTLERVLFCVRFPFQNGQMGEEFDQNRQGTVLHHEHLVLVKLFEG